MPSAAEWCTRHGSTSSCQARARLITARREGLRQLLADWSPDQYGDLAELLNRMVRRVVGDVPSRQMFVVAPRSAAAPKEPPSGQPAVR